MEDCSPHLLFTEYESKDMFPGCTVIYQICGHFDKWKVLHENLHVSSQNLSWSMSRLTRPMPTVCQNVHKYVG